MQNTIEFNGQREAIELLNALKIVSNITVFVTKFTRVIVINTTSSIA